MDNVSKMRASLKRGLKTKDTLIPTKETVAEKEKIPAMYPFRLQVPINQEQNLLLTKVAGLRKGAAINKNSVVRALINLLEDIHFSEGDELVATEGELENLLRQKLKGS